MQIVGSILGLIVYLGLFGGALFVIWQFYDALARIGGELHELKAVLQDLAQPRPPQA